MDRRAFWGGLLLVALAGCARPPSPADERPPNVLFILADDLGYGDVRAYNPESKVPTPNLDRLAAEGLLFTDAHSPSTVCTPTRYGIMTGRMQFRTDMPPRCWRADPPSSPLFRSAV